MGDCGLWETKGQGGGKIFLRCKNLWRSSSSRWRLASMHGVSTAAYCFLLLSVRLRGSLLAHASLLIEFAKFTLRTVSNCEMQIFQVAPVASPETHGKQHPPKWCLCLQRRLPGKKGSQLRCPSLLRALAPPDSHTVLVLVTPLGS